MSENKLIFTILTATIVLAFGLIFVAARLTGKPTVEASTNARALVSQTSYEWGEIGINDGKAEATFEIKNDGTDTLKLFEGTTSCACTTGQLFTDSGPSPIFGMHTSSKYVTEVAPGETAKLTVIFDPLFHGPNGIGDITRTVTMSTNDPANPTLGFFLSAKVIK